MSATDSFPLLSSTLFSLHTLAASRHLPRRPSSRPCAGLASLGREPELRPTPPVPLLGRLPARARPPPLFLCSFASADDAQVPSPAPALAGAAPGENNHHRITEILSRGRNPMLVGVGAASAADDFARTSPYRILPVGPTSVNQMDLAVAAPDSGLILSIGDLKDLVPDEADLQLQERGRRVVSEVTRLLETHRAGQTLWVMGWSATYETYLAFLSKFPLVDKDWELQLLPVTVRRDAGPAAAGAMPPATTATTLPKPATTSRSFLSIWARSTCSPLFYYYAYMCARLSQARCRLLLLKNFDLEP